MSKKSDQPKLSQAQKYVLELAYDGSALFYHDVTNACGGNGRTISALENKGLLKETTQVRGHGRRWKITPKGRKAAENM